MKRITLDDLFKHFETFNDNDENNGVFNVRNTPDGTLKIQENSSTLYYILSGYSNSDFMVIYNDTIQEIEKRGWKYEIITVTPKVLKLDSYSGNSIMIGIISKGVAINLQNDSFAKAWKGRK